MSDNTPVHFGIVGAGAIAQAYAQAFGQTAAATLVAVADCRSEAARALAEANTCKSFDSAQQMLAETDVEAVVVCTPPSTHQKICCQILDQGVNVLCEKPLSINSSDAIAMIDAAERAGVVLTMASKFRYVEDVNAAKAILESGVLGELVLFENVFTGRVDMTHRWNSDPGVAGGGVLIDNGTHSVDITRYFLGRIAEVQVMEGNRTQDLPVEDTVKMFVRSHSGVMGSVDLSWSVNKEQPYFIMVYGTAGTLLVGWRESKYRRSNDAEWTVIGNGYDKVTAFRRQLENFAGAIRGTEELLVTPVDALASVEVIEAAYRSMHKGTWEPIESNGSLAAVAT